MNILILGSKPKANFDKFDLAYCANAASSFYQNDLRKKGGRIISVISASEMSANQRHNQHEKTRWLSEKQTQLCDNSKDEINLIKAHAYLKKADVVFEMGFKGELEIISDDCVEKIYKETLNSSLPIVSRYHFKNMRLALRTTKVLLQDYLKKKSGKLIEYSGLFRPSTGVFSLLLAIYKNGPKNDYYVSGIGISDRGIYPDGWQNTWTPTNRLNTFHVIVDQMILENLSTQFKIHFDDKSLKYLN